MTIYSSRAIKYLAVVVKRLKLTKASMTQTFTPLDLVRFLYQETSHEEACNIANLLESDEAMNREFAGLQRAFNQLNALIVKPSNKSVNNVLNYSTHRTCDEYAV